MAIDSSSGPGFGAGPDPGNDSGGSPLSPAAIELRDFVDAVAEKVEKRDPVVDEICGAIDESIRSEDVELPRHPDVAARILDLAKDQNASMKDILRQVRTDPALAGRILEMANSAAYAGSQPVYSLQMAIVRLGIVKVGEVAFEMTGGMRNFQKDKRSNMLVRLWKYSMATAFACEELAKKVNGEQPETGFLTGLFHNIASPLIVETIGRLEREGLIAHQSDARVLGILDEIGDTYTVKLVNSWNVPKPSAEAVRLQHAKVRDRRGKPLAHLLVCGKAVAAEMGMGVRPEAIDFNQCRDFHFLRLDDHVKIEPARDTVIEKMIQLSRS